MVSHVGWSFLLLRSEERECVLCHVDRSCPARKACMEEKKEFVLYHVGWLVLLLGGEERGRVLSHVGWSYPCCQQGKKQKERVRNG